MNLAPHPSDTPLRVAVAGARGRMGRETVLAITGAGDMEIVAEIGRGDDIVTALAASRPDVLVEFSTPASVMENVRAALAARVPVLVGATGWSDADVSEIATLCEQFDTPTLLAPNFALGAVLLMRFAKDAARYFPDAEIIEMHHERKLDAPSGTAIRTARLIAEARAEANHAPIVIAPDEPDARGEAVQGVRVHSVRLPGFVASQEVIFGGAGERLTLRHDSTDRHSFMPGVLLAVRRIRTRRGLLIGLENLL